MSNEQKDPQSVSKVAATSVHGLKSGLLQTRGTAQNSSVEVEQNGTAGRAER